MKAYLMDKDYAIVANSVEEAVTMYLECGLGSEEDIVSEEVNIDSRTVLYSLKYLPEEYCDQNRYPRKRVENTWCVEISCKEAMNYHSENNPYILTLSHD